MRIVAYGDTHYPFQDDRALAVIAKLVQRVKPEVLIHMGDLIDGWQISTFDKNPARRSTLQHDIDLAMAHLKEMYMLTPNCLRYYLEGNHEFRLTKTIERAKEAQREVMGLRTAQAALSWPVIMEEAGVPPGAFQFVPARGQARRRLLPKMVIKHGTHVTKWSGATAKMEWMRYGMSGISGHTHRLGMFFHSDMNGAHVWAETGCTCDLLPEYVEDPDWQHGAVVITHTKERFAIEPVYIQDGVGIWRDKELRA